METEPFDLDAARKARAEARNGDAPQPFRFGGRMFALPAECPVEISILWATKEGQKGLPVSDLLAGVRLILGQEQYAAFMAITPPPSGDDLTAFTRIVAKAYRLEGPGESTASDDSSPKRVGGRRSRPTSSASTTST